MSPNDKKLSALPYDNVPAITDYLIGIQTAGTTDSKFLLSDLIAVIFSNAGSNNNASTFFNPYKFKVYRNSAANTGSGAFAIVTFDTKDFDTSSNYSTGTGLFTAPIAGFYHFNYNVTSTAGTFIITALFKNGTEYEDGLHISTPGGGAQSTIIQLAASDTIAVYSQANGAAALQVGVPRATVFSGHLISAT